MENWLLEAVKVVAAVGPYPVLLLVAILGMWRLGRWSGPVATKLIDAHVKSIETDSAALAQISEAIVAIKDALTLHDKKLDELLGLMRKDNDRQRRFGDR